MPKLKDFTIQDFSGGLVTDKSDYEMNRNEFPKLRNFYVDERGKLRKRGGYVAISTALSNIAYAYTHNYFNAASGGANVSMFLLFDNASNANMYSLATTSLTNSIAIGDISATVTSSGAFSATNPSTFVVDGDYIVYTAKPTGTTFTITASSILKAHLSGKPLTQWGAAVATGIDARAGLYFASLGVATGIPRILISGRGTPGITTDGTSVVISTDDDAPSGLFATAYRDRIYVAGSGEADAVKKRNGDPIRVSFTAVGDAVDWGTYTVNYFDVEDNVREMISGLRNYKDKLLIFKPNSTFGYNETSLKQLSASIGAYNQFVVQEIDGLIYTFCPAGVFVGNGYTWRKISDPIKKYLDVFAPIYDSTYKRVINNCFSAVYDKKYYLFLGSVYFPNADTRTETYGNVVLVYDTVKNNWTTVDFPTIITSAIKGLFGFNGFYLGDIWQTVDALFMSDGDGFYRMENDKTSDVGGVVRGSTILADRIFNNSGYEISAEVETSFYDMGNALWWKKLGYLRILVESGNFNISYRLDKGTHFTDWISLGNFFEPNKRVKLKDDNGYRIAFKIANNDKMGTSILNGLIIEDIDAEYKK